MPEMLRFQRRGENIYYTPLSDDRHHILIDDMTRESLKKLQEDGFRPAVVLESSPGNYQCLLTIPRRICTAASNEVSFFAYLVAIPRHRLRWRKAFSTRCLTR